MCYSIYNKYGQRHYNFHYSSSRRFGSARHNRQPSPGAVLSNSRWLPKMPVFSNGKVGETDAPQIPLE